MSDTITWYHGGGDPAGAWDPRNGLHVMHLGTLQAALDRVNPDKWDPAIENAGLVWARLYEVSLRPGTRFSETVLADDGECGSMGYRLPFGVDAARYLNIYEDEGSISIAADPAVILGAVEIHDPFLDQRRALGAEILDWISEDGEDSHWGSDAPEVAIRIVTRFPELDSLVLV